MRLTSLLAFLALLAACGSASEDVVDAAPGSDASPDPRFGEARVGFVVAETRFSDGSELTEAASINGAAYENEPPVYHVESMRAGSCRMLTYDVASCTPFCNGVCREGNICDPFPTFESVGTVTVSGMSQGGTLGEFDGRYFFDGALDSDIFDSGDVIMLTATGTASASGFSLATAGVEALDHGLDLALTLVDGRDNTLEWTAGRPGDRVRLVLRSTNVGHGLPLRVIVECDGPDSGSITVPQAMVDGFPQSFGNPICVSVDCPNSELTRYRVDEAAHDGSTAELVVAQVTSFPLIHNP